MKKIVRSSLCASATMARLWPRRTTSVLYLPWKADGVRIPVKLDSHSG